MTTTTSRRFRHQGKGFQASLHALLLMAGFALSAPAAYAANTVGTAPGQFSVSPTGAATYQIPIDVPPGVNGLKPSLALLYNSQAGNGLLGQGWSLSGLSVISHCPQTIDQDGLAQLPFDSSTDRLCLDGQRLILTSGTYGAAGSTYRTEIDSFRAVTVYQVANNSPSVFTVIDRAGLTSVYGGTNYTVAGGNGGYAATPLLWLVSSITDRYGNFINFSYNITNYSVANGTTSWDSIAKITYGHASNAVVGRVLFSYGSRSDYYNQIYALTPVTANPTELTGITVKDGNSNVLRTFTLGYQNANPQQQLATPPTELKWVQECGSDGRCYPATTFSYDGSAAGFALGGGDNIDDIYPMPGYQVADFDGDGLPDYIFVNGGTLYVVFGSNNSQQVAVPVQLVPTKGGMSLQGAVAIDLNGDGKQELLVPEYDNPGVTPNLPTWHMLVWNGSAGSNANLVYEPVPTTNGTTLQVCNTNDSSCPMISVALDIKRNGQAGLLFGDNGVFYYYANVNGALNPSRINTNATYSATPQLVPFDWQGNAAVYVPGQGSLYTSVIDWNPTAANGQGAFQEPNNGDGQYAQKTLLLDANGDGLTSAVVVDGSSFYFVANTGTGFDTSNPNNYIQCFSAPANADIANIEVIDWFRDGRQELVLPVGNVWYLFDPIQCAFFPTSAPVPTHDPGSAMQLLDVNGDGQPDLVYTYNNHTQYLLNYTRNFLINQITDGLGHNIDVGYVPLGAETRGAYVHNVAPANVNAPQTRIYTGPMNIVKDFAVDSGTFDGSGNPQQVYTYYLYAGAAIDQWGRGFLGFSQVEAINYNTGLYTMDTYRQDFPYAGMVASSSKSWNSQATLKTASVGAGGVTVNCTMGNPAEPTCIIPNGPVSPATTFVTGGVTISTTNNIYKDAYATNRVYAGVYSPYASSSATNLYDTGPGNALYETTTTGSTYQVVSTAAGASSVGPTGLSLNIGADVMPTDVTVTTYNLTPGNSSDTETVDTTSDYTNTNWEATCPGHPGSVTVKHTTPIVPQGLAQTETFSYDSHCFLTSDVKNIIDPAGSSSYPKTLTKAFTADGYGNPLTSAVTIVISGTPVGRTTTIAYDSSERFPATITNPLNQTETLGYDAWGNKLTDTDPNGNAVTYIYDGFERKTHQSGPLPNVSTSWTYAGCSSNCAANVAYQATQTGSDGSTATTQYDELSRAVRSSHIGFSGETINQDTQYDLMGRVNLASAPYKSGATLCWDVKNHDVLNRVTTEYQPSNAGQCGTSASATTGSMERTLTTSYTSLQTKRITADPSNSQIASETTITTVNVLGKPSSVIDPKGTTTYSYDPWGNLTSATPPDLATVSMTYDSAGDKLTMQDPDMGAWSYTYDGLGELLTQTDAKGQTVTNQYDLLGRLVNRNEAEGVTRWAYDIGYGAGIGKLAYTAGPNGVWEGYAYDVYGEPTDKITVVGGQEYWVTTTYTDQGQVAQVVYPTLNGINVSGTPAIPSGLTVAKDVNDPTAFDLNWTLAQNGQIYHLYRTLSTATSPGDADEIYSGPAPNWQDSTITKTQTYTWWLKACNGNAPLCSAYASVTLAVTLPPTVPVPFAPGGVQPAASWPITWTAASLGTTGTAGPISYVVQAQFNGGAWTPAYTGAGTTNDGGQTYSSPVVAGSGDGNYAYRVQSCASGSCSNFSASATVSITIQPSVPQSIIVPATVTPQTSPASIAVNWGAPAVNGGTANLSYTVAVYKNSVLQRTSTAQSGTGFTDSESLDGTYSYTVTVCDTVNTSLCAPASSSNVAVTLPPANPGLLPLNSDSNTPTWNVGWTPASILTPGNPSGTVSYTLQQAWNGGGFSTVLGTPTYQSGQYWLTATAALQSGYYQNGTYTYQLRACTTDTNVSTTAACTAWIPYSGSYITTIAPGAPRSLNVPSQSNWDGSFTVTYSTPAANSGGIVTGYNLQVYDTACTDPPNPICHNVVEATCTPNPVTGTSCTFAANSLPAGNNYYGLQVRANDNGVHGPWVQGTAPTIVYTSPPPAPTINETDASDGSHYTITYSASTATTYQLYFSSSTKTGSWSAWTQVYSGSSTSYYTGSPIGQYYLRYYAVACNQHAQCSPNSSVYSFTNPKEVTGCMTCSQTNPPTPPPAPGSTASAVSNTLGGIALAASPMPAVTVPVTRVSAPELELPVLRALAMNTAARPGSNGLKRLRVPHLSTTVARHGQTLAALTHRQAHASHLLATATLNPRHAYFLGHAWHTPKSLRMARANASHGKDVKATAQYVRAIDPRLSLYPPLRHDPRVLAHYEAAGGYLPGVMQDATLQEDCGSSSNTCSEPPVGSALMVGYVYNSAGYLSKVEKLDSGGNPVQILWQGTDETAQGQVDQQTFDEALNGSTGAFSISDNYDAASGLLNGTAASGTAGYGLSASYTWDGYNNLLSRGMTETVPSGQTGSPALSESFTYDAVNRLTGITDSYGNPTAISYNTVGGFISNGVYTNYQYTNPSYTVGSYTYSQPHAVSSISANGVTRNFIYDANGNLATESGDVTRTMNNPNSWTSYNKPNVIIAGAITETFTYGPSRERLATSVTNSVTSDTVTTTYIDGLFEQVQDSLSGNTTYRHYILVGSVRVGVETLQANSGGTVTADTLSFYVHDQVGSVIAAVTENMGGTNQQLVVYSHDVWGKARPSTGSNAYIDPLPATYLPGTSTLAGQQEGFAGHEDLEDIGIVDMEGRIYDPELGRFLSPDPNVQFPDSSQGYNPYTYVNNNALSLSDPTGYLSTDQALGIVAAAVVTWACYGTCSPIAAGLMAGAADGYVSSGGQFDQAGISAFEALPYAAVGGVTGGQNPSPFELGVRSTVEGLIGGAFTQAGGGRFSDGFLGSFASSLASGGIDHIDAGDHSPLAIASRTAVSAIVGGTVSRLTGGDFTDGALSAAMQRLFNDENERKHYEADVVAEANAYHVPADIASATVQLESDFDANAVNYNYSASGIITSADYGLMQVNSNNFGAQLLGPDGNYFTVDAVKVIADPDYNIKVGMAILANGYRSALNNASSYKAVPAMTYAKYNSGSSNNFNTPGTQVYDHVQAFLKIYNRLDFTP